MANPGPRDIQVQFPSAARAADAMRYMYVVLYYNVLSLLFLPTAPHHTMPEQLAQVIRIQMERCTWSVMSGGLALRAGLGSSQLGEEPDCMIRS